MTAAGTSTYEEADEATLSIEKPFKISLRPERTEMDVLPFDIRMEPDGYCEDGDEKQAKAVSEEPSDSLIIENDDRTSSPPDQLPPPIPEETLGLENEFVIDKGFRNVTILRENIPECFYDKPWSEFKSAIALKLGYAVDIYLKVSDDEFVSRDGHREIAFIGTESSPHSETGVHGLPTNNETSTLTSPVCFPCSTNGDEKDRLHFKMKTKRDNIEYKKNDTLMNVMETLKIDYSDNNLLDIRVKSKSLFEEIKSGGSSKTLEQLDLRGGDYIELVYADNEHDYAKFQIFVRDADIGDNDFSIGKEGTFTNSDVKKKIFKRFSSNGVTTEKRLKRCHLFEYFVKKITARGERRSNVIDVCMYKPLYDHDRPPLEKSDAWGKQSLHLWKNCEFVDLKERKILNDWDEKWPWGDVGNVYWFHGVRMFGNDSSFYFAVLCDGSFVEIDSGVHLPKTAKFHSDTRLDNFIKGRRDLSVFISFIGEEGAPINVTCPQNLDLHCRVDKNTGFEWIDEDEDRCEFRKLGEAEGFWVKCDERTAGRMTDKCRRLYRESTSRR